jgi:hypothetical protein
MPHVAVLDADPSVFGYSTAQRRCRTGQVHAWPRICRAAATAVAAVCSSADRQ